VCGQVLPKLTIDWMTTEQVVSEFGVDPRTKSVLDPVAIRSKLVLSVTPLGPSWTTLWLRSSVESVFGGGL
jgi:hypothetical protein